MNCQSLLKDVEIKSVDGVLPEDIANITDFSEDVKKNSLFFCVKGSRRNGEDYVKRAISRGATLILSQEKLSVVGACVVEVEDIKLATAVVCKNFYGDPTRSMRVVGVVGTNGKTSTCHILADIFDYAGYETGVIGTLGIKYGDVDRESSLTTLGIVESYRVFAEMKKVGVEVVFIEVSAHAIAQRRCEGIEFECLIFTNCTEDHLDYFRDFETYKDVKKSIFRSGRFKYAVVSSDDETGREILRESRAKVVTYGVDNPSDVFAVNITQSIDGLSYVVNLFDMIYEIRTPLLGTCNVYNTLAASACAAIMGVRLYKIAGALKRMKAVKGRAEFIGEYGGGRIYLDYAHTPDGLKRTLSSFRKICDGKLFCLFGCGGNREKEKRPLMGGVAATLSDYTIITTDNPRFEDACAIISEIESGVRKVGRDYVTIADRREAIRYAISLMKKGDILVIAGKGAETYQDVMGVKREFSDEKEVARLLAELKEN